MPEAMKTEGMPEGVAVPPTFCLKCQRRIVDELKIGPDGPWASTIVLLTMLLFQVATADQPLWTGVEDVQGFTDKLHQLEICLGCRYDRALRAAIGLMRSGNGHVGDVILRRVIDPSWNVEQLARQR